MTAPPAHAHPAPPRIDVVLFDVGGVLVELSGMQTLIGWLGHSLTEEELWVRWLRSKSVREFETGLIDEHVFAAAVTREFGLAVEPRHFIESFAGWPLGVYPGALEMLARIPSRYRRALLSNSNALHWPRVSKDMGVGAAFDHHFVSHLTGKIKPDAAAFEDVLDSLQCRASQVLFLDDNLLNVEAAARIGMHAARVQGPREALRVLAEFGIIEEHA